jgi:signal transduction histidine kinase
MRMLEAIDSGTNRMSAVVEDLLSISLLQLREIQILSEAFDLIPLIAELIRKHAGPEHPIRLDAPQAIHVLGDPTRLRRVITVLLDNAVRYSPKGGPIDVKVAADSKRATVTVRDLGIGIPKNVQSHIFERFFRAHSGTPHDYGGLGIGLALSAAILKAHGQKIWFESEEGKGSAFSFTLDLAPADSP